MAITRRQFVTRLSTLAAAMGMSQVDLAKVTEAMAHSSAWAAGPWTNKPKVVWVHGAECTGCSTSLLSLFEDVRGTAIEGTSISTLKALDLAVGGDGDGGNVAGTITAGALGITKQTGADHPFGHRTLFESDAAAGANVEKLGGNGANSAFVATIADVLIDFIDLQYHETVMGMGGDLAYKWLLDLTDDSEFNGGTAASVPFVLVVEGAVQPSAGGGYWNKTGAAPWCSIGMAEQGPGEHAFDEVVAALASHSKCVAVIPIGQCACFGGYPACVSPVLGSGQTGAMGTYKFLQTHVDAPGNVVSDKVINVPGCPTNPWWFVLTVVAWLVDFVQPSRPLGILTAGGAINTAAVDSQRRLKAVYGVPLHGPQCKRFDYWNQGIYATKPGEPGCLQLIGCKGMQTMTLCAMHGWNGQAPHNSTALDYGVSGVNGSKGGNCVAGGHPCMACTETGYPDAFLPFVIR